MFRRHSHLLTFPLQLPTPFRQPTPLQRPAASLWPAPQPAPWPAPLQPTPTRPTRQPDLQRLALRPTLPPTPRLAPQLLFLPLLLLLILPGCRNNPETTPQAHRQPLPEVTGVSTWDRISTKHVPERNSPTATLLSLGETFLFLDSVAIDSAHKNMKFLKAQLSDSSIVWVYDFASVLNAKTAVITGEVPLYRRPDLMTITDEQLQAMNIVAVTEEWDDWVKVVGEKNEKQGWIHQDFITYTTTDIAFALLATRVLKEEETEQRLSGLEELREKNPYPATIFLEEISLKIDREREALRENAFDRGNWLQHRNDR